MIVEVTMPVLGLTMEQGTIVAWLKEVGDQVEAGEPLFLVETDKATSDAPAPAAGTLARVLSGEGETVAVGSVVALLAQSQADLEQTQATAGRDGAPAVAETGGEAVPAAIERIGDEAASPAAGTGSEAARGRVFASPRARARARELGVDLSAAAATAGRLTERDVLALARNAAAGSAGAQGEPPPALPAPHRPTAEWPVARISRTREIIAERMTRSAITIPQVTYTLRCDVTQALTLRRSLRFAGGRERVPLSLDALLVRATAMALLAFPAVNSEWAEGRGIRLLADVNIAVAVDLQEHGLVIPVVHGADRLDLKATAAELARLVEGARAGGLGPDDYAGATFTISSLASLGVETFTPLIVPPQAAILGVGAVVPTPVFQQDRLVKRRMVTLSLTTDHRILDGAPSARFLARIKGLLEQPQRLTD